MARVEIINRNTEIPRFFSSGSTQLDLINGGGWAVSRTINLVGDQSCGKTLLGIEACANFGRLFSSENIKYNECERAFDISYAESVGLPKGLDFASSDTAQEFHLDLVNFLEQRKGSNWPCLYVLDSFDALSDDAEREKEISEGSYHVGKAKVLHEIFRRDGPLLEEAKCTLMIISQTKDKIGVTFGETKTRSGGHALDFYPSQIVWLSHKGQKKRTVTGVERAVGVHIRARNKKNKMGKPFGEAEFTILFNYGVDDEESNINWLAKNKLSHSTTLSLELSKYQTAIYKARDNRDKETLNNLSIELKEAVKERWQELELAFEPVMHKYGD